MAGYTVPETAEGRISDFRTLVEEFEKEYSLFSEKKKKVSGHRSRKALLSLAKLTRYIRKDIQMSIPGAKEKENENENENDEE